MGNEEEEEVVAEVEAVEAVYGTDCVVLHSFPPHFHISLKPRTADVTSQQFVEAVLEIRASPQYPKEPPSIDLVDCKGLDEHRQKHLLYYIQSKANELSPCLMLVALCEEAVEKLSTMNHPDGDCPLCLFPLVPEDQQSETLPFMKLMSCFHCFHSECIIRWWKWLQNSEEVDSANTDSAAAHHNRDKRKEMEEGVGNCPVCRKPFLAKDIDHVLALVGVYTSQLWKCAKTQLYSRSEQRKTMLGATTFQSLDNDEVDDEKLLQSEDEIIRREKFEAILNLQKEKSGLIEPKRDIVILPGMYLPQPVALPSSTKESDEHKQKDLSAVVSNKESDGQQQKDPPAGVSGKHSGGTSNGPSSSRQRNLGARRQKARSDNYSSSTVRNPRKPGQQWVRRDNPSNKQ